MKSLVIASDHAGFELKKALLEDADLKKKISFKDLGTYSTESTDYPNYAHALCKDILGQNTQQALLEPCGVLICGSGVGMSIAANRHAGIRAVLTWDEEVARLSRAHNASNVLCFGARFVSLDQAKKVLLAWLAGSFEGGRHQKRIDAI